MNFVTEKIFAVFCRPVKLRLQTISRRVLSETKALVSPPMSLGGINFFVEEGEIVI